jgi:hypothetical protein
MQRLCAGRGISFWSVFVSLNTMGHVVLQVSHAIFTRFNRVRDSRLAFVQYDASPFLNLFAGILDARACLFEGAFGAGTVFMGIRVGHLAVLAEPFFTRLPQFLAFGSQLGPGLLAGLGREDEGCGCADQAPDYETGQEGPNIAATIVMTAHLVNSFVFC